MIKLAKMILVYDIFLVSYWKENILKPLQHTITINGKMGRWIFELQIEPG